MQSNNVFPRIWVNASNKSPAPAQKISTSLPQSEFSSGRHAFQPFHSQSVRQLTSTPQVEPP